MFGATLCVDANTILHNDVPRQDARGYEWQGEQRRAQPFLVKLGVDDGVDASDVFSETLVVEGKHGREVAARAGLQATSADLVDDVLVVPRDRCGGASHGCAIHLAPACKVRVGGRATDGRAPKGVARVPYDAPRPRLHLLLPNDLRANGARGSTGSNVRHCRAREGEPRFDPADVDIAKKELRDMHVAPRSRAGRSCGCATALRGQGAAALAARARYARAHRLMWPRREGKRGHLGRCEGEASARGAEEGRRRARGFDGRTHWRA